MTPTERFEQNKRLVYWVFNRLPKVLRKEKTDVIQEGKVALWNCCLRYDEEKGKFASYAIRGIRNEMIKYIFKRRFLIRPTGVNWSHFYDVKRKIILMKKIQVKDERYEVENELEKVYNVTDIIERELIKETGKFGKMVRMRVEGLSFREIAKMYGVTHQCVSEYYNRNMKHFKDKIIACAER